jgi:YbbR domain-containing protein
MQSRQSSRRGGSTLSINLIWFLGSLALAFFVWVIATTGSLQERRFTTISVQLDADPGLLIVGSVTRTVSVTVRAPEDVLGLLTRDDIIVRADLRGKGPGTHTVELDVDVSRTAVADTQPAQVTVTLDANQSRLVDIDYEITGELTPDLERDAPEFDTQEFTITGPSTRVQQVVAVRAVLDLSSRRATFEAELSVSPVDADGDIVNDVTVSPQSVNVTVPIRQRTDVRRVSITPNIGSDTLPAGYSVVDIENEPQTVFVRGDLTSVPDTLTTPFISLEGQTSTYQVTVPVQLPEDVPDGTVVILGNREVTVTIVISAVPGDRQFENVPVTFTGLDAGLTAQLVPTQVTVLLRGPEIELTDLTVDDVLVTVDLSGLTEGVYDIEPIVAELATNIEAVSLLPATVVVSIAPEDAEVTEQPGP